MPKVGTIELTEKQNKRTFHLPIKQTVIVPSTSGIKTQKEITETQLKTRVRNVRKFMAKRFGGFTSVKAVGGFILKDGNLVKERTVKVTAFATKGDFKKHKSQVIRKVGTWGRKWKQESVAYENEGDLFVISPPKKRRITPSQKKVLLRNLIKARSVKLKRRK